MNRKQKYAKSKKGKAAKKRANAKYYKAQKEKGLVIKYITLSANCIINLKSTLNEELK